MVPWHICSLENRRLFLDWVRSRKVFLRWKSVQRDTGEGTFEDTVAFQYDPHNVRELHGEEAVITQLLSVPTRIQLRRIREEDTDRDAVTDLVPPQGRVIPPGAATEPEAGAVVRPRRKSQRTARKATKKQREYNDKRDPTVLTCA